MSEIINPFSRMTQEEANKRLASLFGQSGNSLLDNFVRQLAALEQTLTTSDQPEDQESVDQA